MAQVRSNSQYSSKAHLPGSQHCDPTRVPCPVCHTMESKKGMGRGNHVHCSHRRQADVHFHKCLTFVLLLVSPSDLYEKRLL